MQLDLGRYLSPFGHAHQMSKVSKSAQPPPPLLLRSRLYTSGGLTKMAKRTSHNDICQGSQDMLLPNPELILVFIPAV